MNFNEDLRTALQEEASKISAPPELKEQILNQTVTRIGGRRRMKKWVVASVLAATLLIPTGAYAAYHYLADTMYGSQETAATLGVTQQQYDRLEAKLQSAKQSFNEVEFAKLMSLLKELGDYNLQMVDHDGVFHLEKLDTKEQNEYKILQRELEPYFEKLNEMGAPKGKSAILDRDTFWNSVLEKAEQRLTKEDFEKTEQLIHELQSFNAKVYDSDGSSHMDRLSKEELQKQEKLMEELNPYMNKIDLMIKPSS